MGAPRFSPYQSFCAFCAFLRLFSSYLSADGVRTLGYDLWPLGGATSGCVCLSPRSLFTAESRFPHESATWTPETGSATPTHPNRRRGPQSAHTGRGFFRTNEIDNTYIVC